METQEPGAGNEVQLTDAIDTLNKTQRVFAREFTGDRYDVGDKFGFMKTSIDYALKLLKLKMTSSNTSLTWVTNLKANQLKKTNIKSIEHDIRWIFHMT